MNTPVDKYCYIFLRGGDILRGEEFNNNWLEYYDENWDVINDSKRLDVVEIVKFDHWYNKTYIWRRKISEDNIIKFEIIIKTKK